MANWYRPAGVGEKPDGAALKATAAQRTKQASNAQTVVDLSGGFLGYSGTVDLQRLGGNRATGSIVRQYRALGPESHKTPVGVARRGSPVQRAPIDIVDPSRKSGWWQPVNTYDKKIKDFLQIQRLLTDAGRYGEALQELERRVVLKAQEDETGTADHLDQALLEMELSHGINEPVIEDAASGAPRYTATLTGDEFAEMNKHAVIAQDPGAYAGHGEYTHRIQWFVILFHSRELDSEPKMLLKDMTRNEFNPPKASWPVLEGAEAEGPKSEGSGSMWDALLDRQHKPTDYDLGQDGLTHPEMFMDALAGTRGDRPSSGELKELAPNIAQIVKARFDMWSAGDDTEAGHRAKAVQEGFKLKQGSKNVFYRSK